MRMEYDPNRSAFIALLERSQCQTRSYILAPHGLKEGDILYNGKDAELKCGNRVRISSCPSGTIVHALAYRIGERAAIARSAGKH